MRIGILGSGLLGGKLGTLFARAAFVAAFGKIRSEVLFDVFAKRRRAARLSLIQYGNSRRAKRVAARLIRDVGFDPVDAGPIEMGRHAEPFTLLIAQLAYASGRSAKLSYRLEWRR